MQRRRRWAIPNHYDHGCLYAVEVGDGVVKVGMSRNPRTRMSTLLTTVRKSFGCDLGRYYVGPDLDSSRMVNHAEAVLIARMQAEGDVLPGRLEFFSGVTFERAQALVDLVSADFLQAGNGRQEGAGRRADSLISHGTKFCPREPLNTTQQVSEAL
jgi:hypothetical protein